jgi:hypothetical protein
MASSFVHPLLVLLVVAIPGLGMTHAAQTQPEGDGPSAMQRLASAYARVEAIDIEWASPLPASGRAVRTRIAVHGDGRFAYEVFEPASSPNAPRAPGVALRGADGLPTGEELRYFVFFDLVSLFTTDGDAGLYFKTRLTEPALSLPPRPQYDLAPWPIVNTLAQQMLGASTTAYRRDGETWSARTPLPDNRAIELAWHEDDRLGPILTRIRREALGTIITVDFAEYVSTQGVPLPMRRTEEVSFRVGNEERHSRTVQTLRNAAVNPPDIDRRIRFNPDTYSMRYVDSATGNVHAREGGPILFNARELNAAFEREHVRASTLARTWFAGVLAAGAGSVALLWRKLRGRP